MTNGLADRLRNNKPADAARIVDELDATLDRAEWSIVAHEAYVGAPAELKAAATRYFVRAARLYIQFLSPTFHMIPWDSSQLLPEDEFNAVFEDVRGATDSFNRVTPDSLRQLLSDHPSSLAVLRMIAWLSRNQISYLLEEHFGVSISGDDLRVLERQGRVGSRSRLERWDRASEQVASLLFLSVRGEMLGLREGVEADKFRPLTDKVDTRGGWESVARLSAEGVPYWALLYQRYVGGVFGQAINASTGLKGDLLEGPVQKLLQDNSVPFYRVAAREKVKDWDQAPDFFVPSKENPVVAIESKVAEDGGTARDKASRIERLSVSAYAKGVDLPPFSVPLINTVLPAPVA